MSLVFWLNFRIPIFWETYFKHNFSFRGLVLWLQKKILVFVKKGFNKPSVGRAITFTKWFNVVIAKENLYVCEKRLWKTGFGKPSVDRVIIVTKWVLEELSVVVVARRNCSSFVWFKGGVSFLVWLKEDVSYIFCLQERCYLNLKLFFLWLLVWFIFSVKLIRTNVKYRCTNFLFLYTLEW